MKFKVIDKKTGKEADAYEIALHEEWAQGLVYCDMEGFAITENGDLMLADECGNSVYCDTERFKVVFEDEELPQGEWIRHIDDLYPEESTEECSVCHEEQRITGNDDNFCPNCGADMSANDKQVTGKLNSEIENSKSEIVPDYRDGWRLKEGEAE